MRLASRAPRQVPVLVGVRNSGATAVDLTLVTGSINLVEAFSYHMQNLSQSLYNYTVPPAAEVTLPYTFQVSPRLGAVKYQGAWWPVWGIVRALAANRQD